MHTRRATRLASSTLAIALSIASVARAQEGSGLTDTVTGRGARSGPAALADIQQLYAEADYAGALERLERLAAGDQESQDRRAIDLYRTLCLVALGRPSDAEAAMTSLIEHDPFYAPGDSDMPPRLRAAFSDKRRVVLRTLIESRFQRAKRDFDAGRHTPAIDGFDAVLKMLAIPEIADAAGRPPLSDLAVLANGFQSLSRAAIAPPPTPAPEPARASTPAPRVQARKIYDTSDPEVTPPATLRQDLPRAITASAGKTGELFIVVDESGSVESAIITRPIDQSYDRLLLTAARKWSYRPATLGGTPVKYRKRIQVVLPQAN